jgi:hypothetical protein
MKKLVACFTCGVVSVKEFYSDEQIVSPCSVCHRAFDVKRDVLTISDLEYLLSASFNRLNIVNLPEVQEVVMDKPTIAELEKKIEAGEIVHLHPDGTVTQRVSPPPPPPEDYKITSPDPPPPPPPSGSTNPATDIRGSRRFRR